MKKVLLYSPNEDYIHYCQQVGQVMEFALVTVLDMSDFLLALTNNGFQVALFDCESEKNDVIRWAEVILRIRPKLNLIIFRNPAIQANDAKLYELGVFFVSASPLETNFEDILSAAIRLSKAK